MSTTPQNTRLQPGQPAPDLELTNANGRTVSLRELRGRNVVVYFYPKAFTPGCTTEACDFRDNLAALKGAGYTVLGVSADDPEQLKQFVASYSLNYDLLSDPESQAAKRWGAWGDKVINGEPRVGPLRSTVVVDGDGTVSSAHYNVDAQGHVARLRDELEA